MMALPQRKRWRSSTLAHVRWISAPSAHRSEMGSMTTAESAFEYQARAIVEPSTALSASLMTIAWHAVVTELSTPNMMPRLVEGAEERASGKDEDSQAHEGGQGDTGRTC